MATKTAAVKYGGIGSAAVQKATGKTWAQWLAVLDRAGARKLAHKDIAALLHAKHGVPDWWAQMVAVGYEQARGKRERHQRPEGYSVSVSRTMAVSVATAYAAWHDPARRKRWMPEPKPITVRTATKNKSLRILWCDLKTTVNVNFYAKGAGKCQMVVQHEKLPTKQAAKEQQDWWRMMLDRLQAKLTV